MAAYVELRVRPRSGLHDLVPLLLSHFRHTHEKRLRDRDPMPWFFVPVGVSDRRPVGAHQKRSRWNATELHTDRIRFRTEAVKLKVAQPGLELTPFRVTEAIIVKNRRNKFCLHSDASNG